MNLSPEAKKKLDVLIEILKSFNTTDLVRAATFMIDENIERLNNAEMSLLRHKGFDRREDADRIEGWIEGYKKFGRAAQALHDFAVVLSAEEFAEAFWAWKRSEEGTKRR